MVDPQYLDGIILDPVGNNEGRIWNYHLFSAGNTAGSADARLFLQQRYRSHDSQYDSRCCLRVIPGNVLLDGIKIKKRSSKPPYAQPWPPTLPEPRHDPQRL